MVMPPGFQPHELAPRYDVESFAEDEWHTYSGERTAKIVAEQLSSCASASRWLLNAGAGVHQLNSPGWNEMAVDLFDTPIRGRKHFLRASVERLPLTSEMFGAIVCVGEVLGYCDPNKAIPEFARVLSPSGILVCDFGSTRSFRRWLRNEHGRAADLITDQYNSTPEPVWIYDPYYVKSLLISSNFRIRHVYGTHTWSAIARRIGSSPRAAARMQRWLDFLPLPAAWADVMTVVAVRGEAAKAQR